jgi:hypothetical protein
VRTKVQLFAVFAILAFASAAHGAEYGVTTCNGQAAATGGWSPLRGRAERVAVGELRELGRDDDRRPEGRDLTPAGSAGWQVFAPANTVIAGATFYRKVAVAGTATGSSSAA